MTVSLTPDTTVETPSIPESTSLETAAPANMEGTASETLTGDEVPAAEAAPAPEAPAFTPNFKLKIMDKELEIPERFRALMTDEKSQSEVREIFEKAYGLDYSKPRYEQQKAQYAEWERGINTLGNLTQSFVKNSDYTAFDEFLKFWGVGKDHLVKYMAEKFRYEDMSPEQKAQYDYQQRQAMENRAFMSQNSNLQDQVLQARVELKNQQLDLALATPDMVELVKAFDAQAGQPGAFRNEVIKQGQLAHFQSGGKEDLSVQEAVKRASIYLNFVRSQSAAGGQQAPEIPGGGQQANAKIVAPVAQKKLPVIPNVGTGGGSPVKKQFNSVADLKARYNELKQQ